MVAIGAALFNEVRERWACEIGDKKPQAMESRQTALVPPRTLAAGGPTDVDDAPE